VLLNGAKMLLKYTKMGQMLKMAQNLNYPENSEFFFSENHIHHIIEFRKVSTNLSIRFENTQQFKFICEI
jgi:hypothetical protein